MSEQKPKPREIFRAFEESQTKRGVVIPENKEQFPKPGKTTVGSLYGKSRKQILNEGSE